MSRPRGNKTPKAVREARRRKVVEGLAANKPKTAIAKELGVSYMTLWRDLTALQKESLQGPSSADSFRERQEQLKKRLDALEKATLQGLPESVGRILLGINHQRAKIDGLYAESRSVIAHVSVNKEATQGLYVEFARRTMKLKHESSWQRLWDFIDSMPDDYEEAPTVLALPEGSSDEEDLH